MLAAVSTQNKLLLGGMAVIFIAFSLVSSLVIRRTRPEFPGNRLGTFLGVTVLLFVSMLLAVEFFAVEEEEAHAEPAAHATTETGGGETTPAATSTEGESAERVKVVAKEFELDPEETELAPGTYEFELENKGAVPHDLTVVGPGVEDAKTPVIGSDERATLQVVLVEGEYELYCSVPGHKDAGMTTTITVGGTS